MKIICAWCHKPMGKKPGNPEQVTHSICDECKEKELEKLKKGESK